MSSKRQKDLATLTKIDAACNTILSLLFMVLMVLFTVFVLDLLGVIHLTRVVSFVRQGNDDVTTNMPFIISTVQEPEEQLNQSTAAPISFLDLDDVTLVGQSKSPSFLDTPDSADADFDTIFTETARTVTKPDIDHKEYRFFQMENKMKVLLIRDPKATMAEASMNVEVGSWHEPKDYPGLAHFCEHMLFQGSKRFPEVGYFDQLVSGTGGYSNAYTEATNTNYYFEVSSGQLVKTLNVFSHFFVDPLFSKDAVDREINAINSEYEIDINGDSWKIMNLFTLLAQKNHPSSRFNIGNTETLTKEEIVKALRKFHSENYSANLMTLVIRSNLDINKLGGWLVHKSDFQKIPNLKKEKKSFLGKPLQDNLAAVVKYEVDSTSKSVILNYQLPGRQEYVHTKPVEFIDYFITSSHENGLKDYLKDQGFIADLEGYVNYVVQFIQDFLGKH